MKTEEKCDHLVDFDVVKSVLSSIGRFAYGPGCVPSHGFKHCARFGNRRTQESAEERKK
jgi:hypothetical protein